MRKLFISLFLLIPIVLSVVIFATPDKTVSENEKRELKTKNNISFSDFQNDFEAYLSDQFIARDYIVSARSQIVYAMGKRDINGAYIGKNRLLQKITDSDIDEASCIKFADKINSLAESVETYVLYVPSAGVLLKQELPRNAEMYDYDTLFGSLSSRLSNAKVVKLTDIEFYRTDHHWTANGAYSAYLEWCTAHGNKPKRFEFETVTKDFKGTLFSKALINRFPSDTIKAPIITDDVTVIADGQSIELYDKSALNTKDKYNYFEGGNHGVLMIENKNVKNGKRLLILKDSFANSFVPYLIGDYEKIVMLDERYTFLTPNDLIQSEKITELAVIKEIVN